MKKSILLFFLILLSVKSFAQGSFYSTIQAGPSLVFSTIDFSPGHSGFFRSDFTTSKLTSVFGAGVGYTFPNQVVQVETGLYKTFPHILLDLDEWEQPVPRGSEAKVYLYFHTWQVPARLKIRLWQPAGKVTFRVITGAVFAFTQHAYRMKGDVINVKYPGRGSVQGDFSFQTNAGAVKNRKYTLEEQDFWGLQSNCVIETGLETSYKFSDKLEGIVSLVFQNGLQTRLSADIYITEPDPTNGQPVSWFASKNSTDGNALNLNFGLAYKLGKN